MKNKFLNIINEKIDTNELTNKNYISTDNMLPNFGGVVDAKVIPTGRCTFFKQQDILLSNIRPYFKKIWYAPFSGGASSDVIVIRTNKDVCLSKYFYYQICSSRFLNNYVANSKGTKMPRGDKSVLYSFNYQLPELREQQHIVDTI